MLSSVERWNSDTGKWSGACEMPGPVFGHGLALVDNERVLSAGGHGDGPVGATAVYDLAENSWTALADMQVPRYGHGMTRLADGRVLAVGGLGLADADADAQAGQLACLGSVEIWSAEVGWRAAAPLARPNAEPTLVQLQSGEVLVSGGYNDDGMLAGCALYDPMTGQWRETGALHAARAAHTATLLADGRVLVIGGVADVNWGGEEDAAEDSHEIGSGDGILRAAGDGNEIADSDADVAGGPAVEVTAEIWDPRTGQWTVSAGPRLARLGHTATLLRDGRVLIAGGRHCGVASDTAEIWAAR